MKKKIKMNISDERHCQELESLGSIFMPIMKDAFSSIDFVETAIIYALVIAILIIFVL